MINSLKIQNIALIDEVEIDFFDGLNILTGETGSGKSIIINSLCFVLGARADKSLIRNGSEWAKVTASFSNLSNQTKNIMKSFDIEEEELVITRKMFVEGKNDIKINGIPATLNMLKQLTSSLVDVYGQFEHSALLDNTKHIQILDEFIGKDIENLLSVYSKQLFVLLELKKQMQQLGGDEHERQQRIDFLSFQITELENAHLNSMEYNELETELKLMQNLEKIKASFNLVCDNLNGEQSAISKVYNSVKSLEQVEEVVPNIDDYISRLNSAKLELEDISASIQNLNEKCEFDANKFNEVEQRLDKLNFLKKKYGKSIDELMIYLDEMIKEKDMLINSEEILKNLKIEIEKQENEVSKICDQITSLRKEKAKIFCQKICDNLCDLGMKNSNIFVDFEKTSTFNENGNDKLEFLFSANLGEPPKPLTKIISGGEMSRFCLAQKCVQNENKFELTMIFDEIDAGVSGQMGQEIAKKLALISRNNQVICISHLPQIAGMADYHYKISKNSDSGKTISSISLIDEEDSIKEIARLAGGENISEFSIKHAQGIKQWAKEQKNILK